MGFFYTLGRTGLCRVTKKNPLQKISFFFLICRLNKKKNLRKGFSIAILGIGFSFMLGVLTIALFGNLTPKLQMAALEYIRYASLGKYIKNLDIIIMVVWISGIIIKLMVFYYISTISISQLFGLESYKKIRIISKSIKILIIISFCRY